MKKFSFRLEKVLEYKKMQEDQKKKELARHISAYNKVQAQMEEARKRKDHMVRKIEEQNFQDTQFLSLSRQSFFGIDQTVRNGKIKLLEIQKQIDLARQVYLAAKQERESFEKLKTKAYQAYLAEVKKEEAKLIEASSMRLWQEGKIREYEWT